MHVKKGDTVLVISGNDKGKTGEIKEAMPSANKVLVEGINMRWKTKKPTQENPKGERIQREVAIDASNVRRTETTAPGKKAAAKKSSADKATATKASKKAAKKDES